MERAKRLELSAAIPETAVGEPVIQPAKPSDTQLSTHAPELAEILAGWPHLNAEIRGTVLALVRMAVRASPAERESIG